MATHPTNIRDLIADSVVDQVDAGATNPQGQIVFQTSGDVEVATLQMSNPAFGNSASGVATANAITDDADATGGEITKGEVQDRDGNPVILFTAGDTGSGSDIEFSDATIANGDTVRITSLTYTAPN